MVHGALRTRHQRKVAEHRIAGELSRRGKARGNHLQSRELDAGLAVGSLYAVVDDKTRPAPIAEQGDEGSLGEVAAAIRATITLTLRHHARVRC